MCVCVCVCIYNIVQIRVKCNVVQACSRRFETKDTAL